MIGGTSQRRKLIGVYKKNEMIIDDMRMSWTKYEIMVRNTSLLKNTPKNKTQTAKYIELTVLIVDHLSAIFHPT